jgi:hypothetical protein
MDPNIRDESRNRRREEALARRLGEALDRTAMRGTELCPDAELIAAYNERALGPEETAQCEEHFVACSRCRKILAVLAASADTPLAEKEVARLGELVAASSPRGAASQAAVPARPTLLHWRARWLAPALGVAAVLAVWFAIKRPWRSAVQGPSPTLIAQAPQNESTPLESTSPVDEVSKAERTLNQEAKSANSSRNSKGQPAKKTESDKLSTETSATNSLDNSSGIAGLPSRAKVAENAPADEKKEKAEVRSATAAAPPPAPSKPPAVLGGSLSQPQASGPRVPGPANQSVTATPEAAPVATAGSGVGGAVAPDKGAPSTNTTNVILGSVPEPVGSNLPLNGRTFQSLSKLGPAKEPTVQIKAPSGKALWRAGKSGRIERSTNAGSAWALAKSPLQEDWLSGAAASDKICWIVGRNGAIARTVDGQHWEKVAPPPMSADASGKFPDWIEVTASSADVATITANDQRHYSTQDGGKTWQ